LLTSVQQLHSQAFIQEMAISRFYTLIAFALCAAQLANAGIIPRDVAKPPDGPVNPTTPYSPDNVHQAVSNRFIGIIELILTPPLASCRTPR
jgi:hypothetical protein